MKPQTAYKDHSEEKQRDTLFNIALKSLERLNDLFDECNYYSALCNFRGYHPEYLQAWKDKIAAIYREISPKLREIDKKEIIDLSKKYSKIGKIIIIKKKPNESSSIKIDEEKFHKKWNILHRLEEKLRKKADRKGMLVPDKPDELAATEV